MPEIARPGNLALLNITSYQAQALQCLYSSGTLIWLGHMQCDRSVDNVLMLLTNGAYTIFFASHILHPLLTLLVRSQTNQPPVSSLIQQRRLKLFGHMARAAASRALRASTDQASLLTGAIQEADLVSPGFEQSRAISYRSTLDFTLHCGDHRIVLPGDASWKRLCSSSTPPDDDDSCGTYSVLSQSPSFNCG